MALDLSNVEAVTLSGLCGAPLGPHFVIPKYLGCLWKGTGEYFAALKSLLPLQRDLEGLSWGNRELLTCECQVLHDYFSKRRFEDLLHQVIAKP